MIEISEDDLISMVRKAGGGLSLTMSSPQRISDAMFRGGSLKRFVSLIMDLVAYHHVQVSHEQLVRELELVRAQRNASNRRIEELTGKLYEMEKQEPAYFVDETGVPRRYTPSDFQQCEYGGLQRLYALPVPDRRVVGAPAALDAPYGQSDDLDEDSPLWLINEQIKGLLEGDGASEDHENVVQFLLSTGLPRSTVDRIHHAIVYGDIKTFPTAIYVKASS